MSQYPYQPQQQYPYQPQGQYPQQPYGQPGYGQMGYPPAGQPNFPGYYAPGAGMTPTSSGFGMASFLISIIIGVIVFVLLIIAGMMEMNSGGKGINEDSPEAMLLGGALILCLLVNILGIVFGIVNLAQTNRKKVFGLLGLIFNIGLILLFGAMVVIGAAS